MCEGAFSTSVQCALYGLAAFIHSGSGGDDARAWATTRAAAVETNVGTLDGGARWLHLPPPRRESV